jgi:predicted Zn-dependent peptidase
MLFHSVFDAKEMEKEKHVIVEEIRMYHDNPLMNIESIFEQALFGGPLGCDIAGTEKHVLQYKRDEVLTFRDQHYYPGNITLVIAGKITEETKKLIEMYFSTEGKSTGKRKAYLRAVYGSREKKHRLLIQHKKTDQVQLMLGFPGFHHTDLRNPAVSVMNTVLGGSMSSRLFVRIREKLGLAYTVKSGADSFRDAGYTFVRAGLEAKNINKAIRAIQEEMTKMIDKGVSERELRDAKTHIHGSLTLSMEDSSSQANWYAHQHLFMDKIFTPGERLAQIEKVSQDDVKKVAKQLFVPKEMRLGIIGDVQEKDIIF